MPTSLDGFQSALASAVSNVDIQSLLVNILLSLAGVNATLAAVILIWVVIVAPIRLIIAGAHSMIRWLTRLNWRLARRLLRTLLAGLGVILFLAFVVTVTASAMFHSNPLAEFLLVGLAAPALMLGMPWLLWRAIFREKRPAPARLDRDQASSQDDGD